MQVVFHKARSESTKNGLIDYISVNNCLNIHSMSCEETRFKEIDHFLFSLRSSPMHALFKQFQRT